MAPEYNSFVKGFRFVYTVVHSTVGGLNTVQYCGSALSASLLMRLITTVFSAKWLENRCLNVWTGAGNRTNILALKFFFFLCIFLPLYCDTMLCQWYVVYDKGRQIDKWPGPCNMAQCRAQQMPMFGLMAVWHEWRFEAGSLKVTGKDRERKSEGIWTFHTEIQGLMKQQHLVAFNLATQQLYNG